MRSVLGAMLVAILAAGCSGCAAMGSFSPLRPVERAMVFVPGAEGAKDAPLDDGGSDAWFTTSDGVRLHGRFYGHQQPRAVVLFCHGNAGSLASWSAVGRQLNYRHDLAVLVFDYRGYGRSAGSPSEEGVFKDGQAAREWLAERTGVRENEIVLIGRSLGGAVAVDLAASGGARGLVLESTFSSLPDVVAAHAAWMLPHWMMTTRMNSAAKIADYHGPLLQSHGDADRLIPIEVARKLYAAAPGRKEFFVKAGADHNDPAGEDYELVLDRFLGSLPAATRSRGD